MASEAGHTPGPWSVDHAEKWPFTIMIDPGIVVMQRVAYTD